MIDMIFTIIVNTIICMVDMIMVIIHGYYPTFPPFKIIINNSTL